LWNDSSLDSPLYGSVFGFVLVQVAFLVETPNTILDGPHGWEKDFLKSFVANLDGVYLLEVVEYPLFVGCQRLKAREGDEFALKGFLGNGGH